MCGDGTLEAQQGDLQETSVSGRRGEQLVKGSEGWTLPGSRGSCCTFTCSFLLCAKSSASCQGFGEYSLLSGNS